VLRVAAQLVFLAAIVGLAAWLYDNLLANMRAARIKTTFDYLDRPAGFQIRGSPFRASQTVQDAVFVGVRNTAALAGIGILLTTVVGLVVGVARLSSNWLVARVAGVYVETLRNIPPLLVIFLVNTAVVLQLPRVSEATTVPGDLLVLSNRQLAVVSLRGGSGAGTYVGLLTTAAIAALVLAVWRTRVSERTGEPHHRVAWAAGIVGSAAVIGHVALGGPVELSRPRAEGFNVEGGISMIGPFAALLVALVIYTASHVAEIVRGSIQAVPRGQVEAASALALTEFQRLRFVTLPQALRIAIPPTINQYLNLTKNTSLGIAIGYAELMAVTQIVIGNGNPAPQSFAVSMLIYLGFSLTISAVVNILNRRLRLVER
jgi:general L-amino acid transport system permease protein